LYLEFQSRHDRHSSKFRDAAQNAIATCAGIAASDYLVGCIDGLALLWLDAREAAVLAISIPVWVSLLAWPVLGERLSLVRALANSFLVVALGGVALALRAQ
jgi:drug/metabolite transporter (DMT)-like permease